MRVGGRQAPAALHPGETQYPLYRRLRGSQGRYGRVRNISPPHRDSIPGPSSRQRVATRPPTHSCIAAFKCVTLLRIVSLSMQATITLPPPSASFQQAQHSHLPFAQRCTQQAKVSPNKPSSVAKTLRAFLPTSQLTISFMPR